MFRFLHEQIIPAPVSRTAIAVPGSGIEVELLEGVPVYIWDKLGWVAGCSGNVGSGNGGSGSGLGGADGGLGAQAVE
ncbi:hypothetical protein QUA35_12100 [Microcoleus sp. N9_B2]|uniref:hypothetical protein n=1 Tax=unclassified Microcoleus TaxID=2642155 RepID=UPI002FD46822